MAIISKRIPLVEGAGKTVYISYEGTDTLVPTLDFETYSDGTAIGTVIVTHVIEVINNSPNPVLAPDGNTYNTGQYDLETMESQIISPPISGTTLGGNDRSLAGGDDCVITVIGYIEPATTEQQDRVYDNLEYVTDDGVPVTDT